MSSRIVYNPFTGKLTPIRVDSIDVDSDGVIANRVNSEIDSGVSNAGGIIAVHTDSVIAKALRPGGMIFDAIDSDYDTHTRVALDSGGLIKLAVDSDIAAFFAAQDLDDSVNIQSQFDSAFPSAFDTRFALQDTHDSVAVQGQIDSAFPAAFDTRFALQDTHDSVAVQGQIDATIASADTHDSVAVQGQFDSAFPSAFDTRFASQDLHDSVAVQGQIDSAEAIVRTASEGGYELTGGFTDRTTGTAGASDVGTDVEYTDAMVEAGSWLRFGLDSAAQDSNDGPYWADGAGSEFEAPGSGTTAYRGKGLFSGFYMPHGVTALFNFTDDSTNSTYNEAKSSGTLQYNAASGSLDVSQLNEGDFVSVRFDFNVTPQFANTTLEVGLIWQTRDSNDVETFTFALTGEPIFYGSGTTGKTFLNRPIITAYLASNEDVNARALPAVRSDQPIYIQPLTTLFTVGR
jgi:hypothetical protein